MDKSARNLNLEHQQTELMDAERANLRCFLAILQRWDREADGEHQRVCGRTFVEQCFTDSSDSGIT